MRSSLQGTRGSFPANDGARSCCSYATACRTSDSVPCVCSSEDTKKGAGSTLCYRPLLPRAVVVWSKNNSERSKSLKLSLRRLSFRLLFALVFMLHSLLSHPAPSTSPYSASMLG